jgi:hypothetical protein
MFTEERSCERLDRGDLVSSRKARTVLTPDRRRLKAPPGFVYLIEDRYVSMRGWFRSFDLVAVEDAE